MLSTLLTAEQYIRKYKNMKESLDLPLKINLYFTFLQASLTDKSPQKNIQFFNGFSPLFYPVFCHLSSLEKSRYLHTNIQFIKEQFDRIQSTPNSKQKIAYIGNSIKASGQISESLMGLVYWSKVQIIFTFESRKVKLITKNRNIDIDLRLYLIRKSKKYQSTIVFQAISEVVAQNDRKISIYLKSTVFQHMYKEIFNCIILFRNQQLYKIAFQQLSNSSNMLEVSFIGHNSKSLSFLGPKNVNQFLNFKDDTIKKMLRANFNFQTVYSLHGRKIQIDKNSLNSKQGIIYKLQSIHLCSVEQLKKNLIQKYLSQSYKYLIQSQQIQKSSNRYSAVYQKFLFQTSSQIFKTIQHVMIEQINPKQIIYENQSLIFQKGLKSLKLDHFFEYLIIKVKKVNDQKKSKLIVVGCFNPQFKQAQNKQNNRKPIVDVPETHQIITMFLVQFAQMIFRKQYQVQNMKKMIEQLRGRDRYDQNQFITVQGNFPFKENQEYVLDFEEKFENDKESYPTFEVSSQAYNLKLQKVQSYVSEVDRCIVDEQQFQDFENEEDNIKNFYLFHNYQLQPQTQLANKQRVLNKNHFLYHQWYRRPKGGLLCKDNKMVSQQKKVANYLIKTLGKRIFQQKGLLNLSLPVTIFRPESHLHSIARNLSFAPIFLQKASKMNAQQRIKMVLLYSLSVTISSISVSKPFNPILGQTLQVWIDGCPVYLQQISHHPPIVAYYMIGRGYKAYGSIGAKINFGFNSIVGYAQQPNFVQFDDGTVIELNFGKMMIGGIVIGERIFNFVDKMYAIDPKNKLFYDLKFGEQKTSFFSKSLQPEDFFSGKIYKIKQQFVKKFYSYSDVSYPTKQDIIQELNTFEGIWNGKTYIDNKQQIDFTKANGCVVQEQKFPLISDSSYRKDIQYLKQGSINSSQVQKQKLQNIQRRDRTLRENYQNKK